jgi:hypothetical protein
MHGQTTIANHPIQLWVVFTRHKSFMILLNEQIPKWSCSEKQWWFKNFLTKMPSSTIENFPFHIFKPLGWFFLMVILGIVLKVTPYKVGK